MVCSHLSPTFLRLVLSGATLPLNIGAMVCIGCRVLPGNTTGLRMARSPAANHQKIIGETTCGQPGHPIWIVASRQRHSASATVPCGETGKAALVEYPPQVHFKEGGDVRRIVATLKGA